MKAVVGGRIMTITHGDIPDGVLLFDGGKIVRVERGLTLPPGTEVIDAAGKYVVPGLIDCHVHIGARGFMGETNNPVSPFLRASDCIDFNDPGWQEAVEGGVTTVITTPGSGNVMSGTSICMKTAGPSLQQRTLRDPAGLKMAWRKGMERTSVGVPYPSSFMGVAGTLRNALVDCQNYVLRREKGQVPEDLGQEMLARVLRHELVARIHIFTPVEILSLLRIVDEFGFDFTIEHGFEAYLIADELARRQVPVIYGPLGDDSRRHKLFPFRGKHGCAVLYHAGVPVSLQTDHPDESIKGLRVYAAMMVRWTDLTETDIMRMLTINGAVNAGPTVAQRVGSLEAGKDADFAIYSSHPLNAQARVEGVYVDGALAWGGDPA